MEKCGLHDTSLYIYSCYLLVIILALLPIDAKKLGTCKLFVGTSSLDMAS